MGNHRLGWVGLGRMGLPLAERLVRAGVDVAGYNRTRAKAEPLVSLGAAVVDRPVDLADRDIVFTTVSTETDLLEVTFGSGGLLTDGGCAPKVLVDCSAISAEASSTLREKALERGTHLLVVAVSGNDVVVRAGKLGIFASGPKETFFLVQPYLALLGASVTYMGEGDWARIFKICHNMFLGIIYQSMVEIAVIAEKAGLPRHVTLEALNGSVLGSTFTRYKTPAIVNLDFSVTFALELLRKDLALALDLARRCGATAPLTRQVQELVEQFVGEVGGEVDYTRLLELQARASGLDLKPENAAVSDGMS